MRKWAWTRRPFWWKPTSNRARSAIKNVGFKYPQGRVVVNLAPGDLAKHGARYDLAIAIAILAATEQVASRHLPRLESLGELSLYGELRPVRGAFLRRLRSRQPQRRGGSGEGRLGRADGGAENHRREPAPLKGVAVHAMDTLPDVARLPQADTTC